MGQWNATVTGRTHCGSNARNNLELYIRLLGDFLLFAAATKYIRIAAFETYHSFTLLGLVKHYGVNFTLHLSAASTCNSIIAVARALLTYINHFRVASRVI